MGSGCLVQTGDGLLSLLRPPQFYSKDRLEGTAGLVRKVTVCLCLTVYYKSQSSRGDHQPDRIDRGKGKDQE
jgi:hypothetical protein